MLGKCTKQTYCLADPFPGNTGMSYQDFLGAAENLTSEIGSL